MDVEDPARKAIDETGREDSHETGEYDSFDSALFDDIGYGMGEPVPVGVFLPEHQSRWNPGFLGAGQRPGLLAVTDDQLEMGTNVRSVYQSLEIRARTRSQNCDIDDEPPLTTGRECRRRAMQASRTIEPMGNAETVAATTWRKALGIAEAIRHQGKPR